MDGGAAPNAAHADNSSCHKPSMPPPRGMLGLARKRTEEKLRTESSGNGLLEASRRVTATTQAAKDERSGTGPSTPAPRAGTQGCPQHPWTTPGQYLRSLGDAVPWVPSTVSLETARVLTRHFLLRVSPQTHQVKSRL